jgi:hypothetical protein
MHSSTNLCNYFLHSAIILVLNEVTQSADNIGDIPLHQKFLKGQVYDHIL